MIHALQLQSVRFKEGYGFVDMPDPHVEALLLIDGAFVDKTQLMGSCEVDPKNWTTGEAR